MATLKIARLIDDRPTKLNIELPGSVVRDLEIYGALVAREAGEAAPIEPTRLIGTMLRRFMDTDRAFTKARRTAVQSPEEARE